MIADCRRRRRGSRHRAALRRRPPGPGRACSAEGKCRATSRRNPSTSPSSATARPAPRARARCRARCCRSDGRPRGRDAAWSPTRSRGSAGRCGPRSRRRAGGSAGAHRCWPGCRSPPVARGGPRSVCIKRDRCWPRSASMESSPAYGSTRRRIEAISATSCSAHLHDERPAEGDLHDQALLLEPGQRFAQRRPADPEIRRDVRLAQLSTRRHGPVEDGGAQHAVDALRASSSAPAHAILRPSAAACPSTLPQGRGRPKRTGRSAMSVIRS